MPVGAAITPPPRPTTLGQSAGEVNDAPPRRGRGPVIAISAVVAVAVLGGGGFLLFGRGGGEDKKTDDTPAVAAKTPDEKIDPPVRQPVEPPVKAPEAVAKTVVISVSSAPDGADIYVGTEATARGKTPMDLSLPRGSGETKLTLKLVGFKDKAKPVKTDRDSNLDFELQADAKAAVVPPATHHHGPKKNPKTGPDKDGVLSPF
jgi:hypothetical protein